MATYTPPDLTTDELAELRLRAALARRAHQPTPTPDVHPKHLDPDGPPHPDPATEVQILRWALGYGPTERDPWTAAADSPTTSSPSRPELSDGEADALTRIWHDQ